MQTAVQIPTVLLPREDVDPATWAVIACDQFTSEPEYWADVERLVGDAPSTFRVTLPEVFLDTPEEPARLESIKATMERYLADGVLTDHRGSILVERTAAGKTRHGLMLALDLEAYDFAQGSTSLVRATEGTIVERIPPRIRVREGAPIELPHILVLIDDPDRTVIEPLVAHAAELPLLYDVDLMLGSGHLTGRAVDESLEGQLLDALAALGDQATFEAKYDLPSGTAPLVYAMGDGNHSLATAKTMWEQIKSTVGPDHPARWALVEIENIHDAGLEFEAIFRVLFDVTGDVSAALEEFYPGRVSIEQVASHDEMTSIVDAAQGPDHAVGLISPDGYAVVRISQPPSNLPVGTLQGFLDDWSAKGGFGRIDYVHGTEPVDRLGRQQGNLGFHLPAIDKGSFFKTVILDGALPRKTFSMGEAIEKRFYFEARRITEA